MGQQLALIACLLAALLSPGRWALAAGQADGGPRWESLSPEQQSILAPVAPEWPGMPAFQRQRLVNAARHYPQLTPAEQARFRARLPDWTRLPGATRNEARDTFRKYHALPAEKKEALKQRWKKEVGGTGPGSAVAPASAQASGLPAPASDPPAPGTPAAPASAAKPLGGN